MIDPTDDDPINFKQRIIKRKDILPRVTSYIRDSET